MLQETRPAQLARGQGGGLVSVQGRGQGSAYRCVLGSVNKVIPSVAIRVNASL